MLIHFDFDGVIVDSLDPLLDLSIRAQQSLGVGRAPTRDDFRTLENLTFYDLGIRIGLSENLASGYANEIFTLQKEKWDVDVFPDIVPVLWELAQRHTLVIITSSHGRSVSKMLERIGLDGAITKVRGGDLGLTKAEQIEQSCQEFQSDLSGSLMVGDAMSDVRQGKHAGVRTVAVTWGYQDRELLEREAPDFVVHDPEALLSIVTPLDS